MTTPRRALSAAASPFTAPDAAGPRRAILPPARGRLARTLTASALVVGVAATAGPLLLRPPAPTSYVAVAAVTSLAPEPEAAAEGPATGESAAPSATAPATSTQAAAVTAATVEATAAPASSGRSATAPAADRPTATARVAAPAAPATTRTPPAPAPTRTTTTATARPASTAPATAAVSSSTAANAVTAQVAAYARAHIGYPYQVGTKGPEVYDCAGLVTAAFASAGVTVRHSMTAQAALGTYVSRENLRPGDIVIWGSPVSAVSVYIGNDTIVIGDGPAYGVRTVSVTERMKYRSFQGGRRYVG